MTMSSSRRRFLLGLSAAGVGLGIGAFPLLSRGGLWQLARSGRAGEAKLKVVFYVVPDGLGVDGFVRQSGEWDGLGIWHPNVANGVTDTTEFTYNEVSGLLESQRASSLFVRGSIVAYGGKNNLQPFFGHQAWKSSLRDSLMQNSSIDILAANAFKAPGAVRFVHAGPHTKVANPWFVTWDGTSMQQPQHDPLVLFDQLFGGTLSTANAGIRSAHVMDAVRGDLNDMKSSIGAGELQKIQTHLDAVEKVAADLGPITPPPVGCNERPTLPGGVDMSGTTHRIEVHEAHNQVVATALGCGLTRVATVQVAASSERTNFPDVAPNRNPHDLAHLPIAGNGSEEDRRDWLAGRSWYIHRFNHFLQLLAAQPDPDVPGDNLLDHTLVVLTSEMADGAPEHQLDMPLLFVGGKHTPLDTGGNKGRYVDITAQGDIEFPWSNGTRPLKQVSMQRIWATLARATGIGDVPYGEDTTLVTGIFSNVARGSRPA
jgi:hypothetical protein